MTEGLDRPFEASRLFADRYDAVVMLTWSDWHLEERSNRYHYATRFAKRRPVYFVQPDGFATEISTEKVVGHDIEVVHVPSADTRERAQNMARFLRERGVRKPLLWIYNPYFERFISLSGGQCRVYHATEDYFNVVGQFATEEDAQTVIESLKRVLPQCDLVVAVSEGVAKNFRGAGAYGGELIVLRNGCDYDFWWNTNAWSYQPPADGASVALFQGVLNDRIDYGLLCGIVDGMPDWQFWFCGSLTNAPMAWKDLSTRPNVRYLGTLDVTGIASAARRAKVGLIPYKTFDYIRLSLPLKAHEYVACGLPVVSVPISELEAKPQLFRIASTAEEFVAAISELAPSRNDEQAVARRLATARSASYDAYFDVLQGALEQAVSRRARRLPRLNVLMLYDERSVHIKTIQEHLDAFSIHSHHRYHFLSATGPGNDTIEPLDPSAFDAIAIHFSVRLSQPNHLAQDVAASVVNFDGPKFLFIQDEYERTETVRRWIERLGIGVVFTSVRDADRELAFPRARFSHVEFIQILKGYVPEHEQIDEFAVPLKERKILIGYRGRRLPHQYGRLGYDKTRIGVEVKRQALARSLYVDIEVDDSKRIYGDDWYRFLGSCRATLCSESGCNLFDDFGDFAKLAAHHADLDFPSFAERFLPDGEGPVNMNQVSPKVFEAIRLHTALVMFEGEYSRVVRPGEHYISLRSDFSNIDEVLNKVSDLDFVRAMTERAYTDIVESGKYSLSSFVKNVDSSLSRRAQGRKRATLVTLPMIAVTGYKHIQLAQRFGSSRYIIDQVIPSERLSQDEISHHLRIADADLFPTREPLLKQMKNIVADIETLMRNVEANIKTSTHGQAKRQLPAWLIQMRWLWRLIPRSFRYTLARWIQTRRGKAFPG
jgi:glycosyltransferase involved in cell wall biosynthesis